MYDVKKLKTVAECVTVMERAKKQGKEDIYNAVLERYQALRGPQSDAPSLRVPVSLLRVLRNAQAGRYTTYGELAEANGVPWFKARHAMNGQEGHLDKMLQVCESQKIPLLSALVVNEGNQQTGDLDPSALRGFIDGAQRLGLTVTDEDAFFRQSQRKALAWVKTQQAFDFAEKLGTETPR